MIAVLKAGGAFVPLDPAHPESRLQFLIEAVDAKLVLCDSIQVEKFSSIGLIPAIAVDDHLLEQCTTAPVSSVAHGGNAAYVIFTSGSTGEPKVW